MIGIIAIGALLLLAPVRAPEQAEKLSDQAMAELVGGGTCYNCQYDPFRFDECLHFTTSDPCQINYCIANYLIEDTCIVGTGTCTAYIDTYSPVLAQYLRADSYCTFSNGGGMVPWRIHYYGSNCTVRSINARCTKPSNTCNGALIQSSTRYPGVNCP